MSKEQDRLKQYSCKLDFGYLFSDKFPEMKVGESKVQGKGIIVKQDIKKGQIICPLFGIIYNMKDAKIDYPKYSYQLSDEMAIETINEPGFLNHSCEPNAYLNDNWVIEATESIKRDTEVLIDYRTMDYSDYGFECQCGSKLCCKRFHGKASADLEYQKQMGKYFSPYLKDKFNLTVPGESK